MIRFSEFTKLRLTMLIAHTGAICGLVLIWDAKWLLLSAACIIAFFWVGQELYCHRYLCHRSFEMPLWVQRVCVILSIYNLFGHPIGIAATHITHHKYSDTNKDPHPALTPWQSWFWVSKNFSNSVDQGVVKRLMRDPWLKFISAHYLLIYFGTAFLVGLFSIKILIYAILIPHVYAFAAIGLITVFCHNKGYRRYNTADASTNNHWVNLMLGWNGAAFHNNHHAKPARYTTSDNWNEIDLIGVFVYFLFCKKKTL